MSIADLKNITQEDIFDYAYLLQGYATYLQDEFNRHQIIVDWCNNQIETLVQKHREDFGQYQKHEQRRYQLVAENVFVHKVNSMLQVAQSRLTSLNGKIWELKQKSNILLERKTTMSMDDFMGLCPTSRSNVLIGIAGSGTPPKRSRW